MKTGQSTLFIILGLLLVLFVGLFFFGISQTKETLFLRSTEFDASPVTTFINQCLEDVSTKAIIETSLQGGYFYVPSFSSSTDQKLAEIPYYVDNSIIDMPSINTIEENIADYITTIMPFCINNFQNGEYIEGATITADSIDVDSIEIEAQLDEKIIIILHYPVTIEKEKMTTTISGPYIKELPVNFTHVYSIVAKIVTEHKDSPDFVPLGVLSAASYDENFSFQVSYLEENDVVYSLTFPSYEINNKPYVFLFAIRYNWTGLSGLDGNKETLSIEPVITDTVCYAHDPCFHNLNVYDEPLTFRDYTELFDVTEAGQISFTPFERDIGIHTVVIEVEDQYGKKNYYAFSIEIKDNENESKGNDDKENEGEEDEI